MAILTKTRPDAEPVPEKVDRAVGFSIRDPGDDGAREVWVEWKIQLANGHYSYRSARVDSDVEAQILALPNLLTGFMLAANNTHPKVTA